MNAPTVMIRAAFLGVLFALLAIGEAVAGGIRGRVMGQDEKGAHLGPVAGAKLELLDKAGKTAATATTNSTGYYEVAGLAPGEFTYRIKAAGFQDENAGRGFNMPVSDRAHVLDFVVTRGASSAPAAGELAGHVWQQAGKGRQPVAGASVALQSRTGGPALVVKTGADGAYRVTLAPGTWRVSATASGFAASLAPQPAVVPPSGKATLDFTFSRTDSASGPSTSEVFVMVSVQRAETSSRAGETPQVQFFREGSEAPLPTTIRPLAAAELANLGLSPDSPSKLWEWFIAQAREPLPEGRYLAKGNLASFRPGASGVEVVSAKTSTYFDLALRPLRSTPDPIKTPDIVKTPDAIKPIVHSDSKTDVLGVHGRVMGQTDRGEHLGTVASAKVEFLDAKGAAVSSATTDAVGFYAMPGLKPGTFTYRIVAQGYQPEDSGRGFNLAAGDRPQVLDFVVTKGGVKPPAPGELTGKVWASGDAGKQPLAGATIMVRRSGGGPAIGARSGADGSYRVELPAAEWQASAMATGFAPSKQPQPFTLAAGGKSQVDFTFAAGAPPVPSNPAQLYAIIAVEQFPEETPVLPKISFPSGAGKNPPAAEGRPAEIVVENLGRQPNGSPRFTQLGLAVEVPAKGSWQWYLARTTQPMPPGNYSAQAMLDGFHPAKAAAKLAQPGLPTVFDLTLDRICPDVTVLVQSKDRQPVPGVEVKFVSKTLNRSITNVKGGTTDSSGRNLQMLEDGLGTYNVMLTGPGLQPQGREVAVNTEKMTLNFQVFKTGEAKTVDLAGNVLKRAPKQPATDKTGKPVSGAKLTLQPLGGPARPVTTQADGRFQLDGVTEGDYRVAIEAAGCFAYAGELKVAFGMEPVTFTVDARNEALENALRLLLTEGWGQADAAKSTADRHYRSALSADPKDCRVDYAMTLAALSSGNLNLAVARVADAIGKREDSLVWDRSCETRLWLLMQLRSTKQAAVELQGFAQTFYATRPSQPASDECAYVMGISVGVLNGPWSGDAAAVNGKAVEQAVLAALKDRLRSEFERGRDEVGNQYVQMKDAADQAKQAALTAATEDKRRKDEAASQRMGAIQKELAQVDANANALNRDARQRVATLENQILAINQQRQQLAAQFQPSLARIQEINNCLNKDRQMYAQYAANPQAAAQAAPVLEEIRDHERELLVLNQKMAGAQAQDRQMQATQANLQTQYTREEGNLRSQLNTLQANQKALTREHDLLRQQINTALDLRNLRAPEADRLEQQKAQFNNYRPFPLEKRRQELLGLLPH